MQQLERRQLLAGDVTGLDRPLGATVQDTGEFFLGRIAVTPVFLNSDPVNPADKTQQWTPGEIDGVLETINDGLTWWSDTLDNLNTVHELEFVVDTTFADSPVDIPNEPIDQNSYRYPIHVRDFLSAVDVDYTGSHDDGMFVFNDMQRAKHDADWSFTIFVVDSSDDGDGLFPRDGGFPGAFAVYGGLYIVMPSQRPVRTVAHEVGHIFWGFDEYSGTDGYNESRGYYNSQNLNSVNGAPAGFSQEDSIMAEGNPMLDAFMYNTTAASTLAVLGWLDSDSDGIFDVLDVPLSLEGDGYFDDATGEFHFSGRAQAQTLVNQNTDGPQSDISLNRISRFQGRVDGGVWQDLLTPETQVADLDVSIVMPTSWQQLDLRVIDDRVGVTSAILTATPTVPMASSASVAGYAFLDDDQDGQRSISDDLIDDVTVSIVGADGSVPSTGQFNITELPIGEFLDTVSGMTLRGENVGNDSPVQILPSFGQPDRLLIHTYSDALNSVTASFRSNAALKVTFDDPVGHVEVDVIGLEETAYGRVEAYNAAGELIDRVTTDLRNHAVGSLGLNETQTLTLVDSASEIAYIRVFGHANTMIGIQNIRHGIAANVQTSAGGVFSFDGLADGQYTLSAEPRSVIESFSETIVTVVDGAITDGFAQLVATRVDSPRFNSQLPEDVNGNDEVTAVDALQIINDLNARQSSEIGFDESDGPSVDVTNDGRVTALDALLVINYLNSQDAHRSAPEPVDNGSLEASSDVVFAQNPSFIASSSDDEIDGISVDRSDPLQLI